MHPPQRIPSDLGSGKVQTRVRSSGDGLPRGHGGEVATPLSRHDSTSSPCRLSFVLSLCATTRFGLLSFVIGEEEERGELPHLAGYPEGEGNWALPYSS
jgi:hypothetical protein